MRRVVIGLGLVLLAACRSGESGERQTAPPPPVALGSIAAPARYLALGDSFTIGTGASPDRAFPARLVARWKDKCGVLLENVAVNGYTTDDVIAEELPAFARVRPSFVTLAIGANDIVRGSTVEAYRANLKRIFAALRGARVVVVPQPDWSQSPVAASFGTRASIAASIAQFNAALAEEAASAGAEFVDLFPTMKRQADAKMIASDGLHPSAAAYDEWADELSRTVRPPC